MSLGWAWVMEGAVPDVYNYAGAGLILLGVCVLYFAPRG